MRAPSILCAILLLPLGATTLRAQEHWVAGDLHEHVTPPDSTGEVSATFSGSLESARAGDLAFLVFTPHLRDDWWKHGADAVRGLRDLADRCARVDDVCLIPGYEDTRHVGHVGVSFLDEKVLAAMASTGERGEFLEGLARAGALLTLNHPVQGTSPDPRLEEFRWDISWHGWTHPEENVPGADRIAAAATSVEVLNASISFAEAAAGVPVGERQVDRAFALLDRKTLETGRRYVPVGGSDNHAFWLVPTTWLSVPDRGKRPDGRAVPPTRAEVREALEHGRACAGGPEAGSLRARVAGTDGAWARIGDALEAHGRPLEVAFEGEGELLLDGRSLGTFAGKARVEPGRGRHHLRLVRGVSCSSYVWIDWSEPRARVYR